MLRQLRATQGSLRAGACSPTPPPTASLRPAPHPHAASRGRGTSTWSGPCRASGPHGPDSPASAPAPGAGAAAEDGPPPVEADGGGAASLVGSAWDPEGLFSKAPGPLNFAAGEQMGDLIARRELARAARLAAAAAATSLAASNPAAPPYGAEPPPPLPPGTRPIRPLPPADGTATAATAAAAAASSPPGGGLRPDQLPAWAVSELDALLRQHHMRVDLATPGLRVLHLDPPVLAVEGFLSAEQCERMVAAAERSERAGLLEADGGGAASLVGSAWDPEGLFSKAPGPLNFAAGEQMGDLIARRELARAARLAAAAAATSLAASNPAAPPYGAEPPPPLPPGTRPIRPLPPADGTATAATAAAAAASSPPGGGLRPDQLPAWAVSELDALLRQHHMRVDLATPGLRVLHLDPPVLAVEGFLSAEQCERMVAAAERSGRMVASRIGAGNVASGYAATPLTGNAASSRRTSTSMMVTPGVAGPVMDATVAELHAAGKRLLAAGEGPAWGSPGKLPRAGQYCYEAIQVARYESGQHFLSHEDGFPPATASANGFQRHATLLVYLNDVPQGGATRFDHLGLAVQPSRGKALLSLHTAEDAVDTKIVTQQWIARGLAVPAAAGGGAAGGAAGMTAPPPRVAAEEAELEEREKAGRAGRGGKAAAGKAGGGKGFGAKGAKAQLLLLKVVLLLLM
ncbi:hypothetical protein TSOC_001536, partial [Tetrabaena socialis]